MPTDKQCLLHETWTDETSAQLIPLPYSQKFWFVVQNIQNYGACLFMSNEWPFLIRFWNSRYMALYQNSSSSCRWYAEPHQRQRCLIYELVCFLFQFDHYFQDLTIDYAAPTAPHLTFRKPLTKNSRSTCPNTDSNLDWRMRVLIVIGRVTAKV